MIMKARKTEKIASAKAVIMVHPKVVKLLVSGSDVEAKEAVLSAQDAGIRAAKKTQESIPMCSPCPVNNITINLNVKDHDKLEIESVIKSKTERTSANMEALSAATITAFMLRDYCMKIGHSVDVCDIGIIDRAS